jgi:hypothetical protein
MHCLYTHTGGGSTHGTRNTPSIQAVRRPRPDSEETCLEALEQGNNVAQGTP